MASKSALNLPSVQKSVQRLSGKRTITTATANRIARREETEKSASPTTRPKRKRPSGDEDSVDESPAVKKMATEQAVMNALERLEKKFDTANERLKDCAQKDDLTAIEVSIRDKVRDNERRLNRIESEMSRTARSVQQLVEECVDNKVAQKLLEVSTNRCGTEGSAAERIDQLERHDYLEARKSIKMWPVKGSEDALEAACREFMEKTLSMPHDTAQNLEIVSVRRIRQARRSKIADEVLVKYGTVEERDIVQSYAPNLSRANGTAGVRIDFPAHLRGTFRLLESHGSLLKRKYPELKRSIKFDDQSLSLVMDVKLSAVDNWERVDERGARASKKERDSSTNNTNDRANPGGMAGRRALMLSSPQVAFTLGQSTSNGGRESRGRGQSNSRSGSWGRDTNADSEDN